VISVMNGFEAEIRSRTLSAIPHLTAENDAGISDAAQLQAELAGSPGVIGTAPYISGKGMVAARGTVRGVKLSGVIPEQEVAVADLHSSMVAGAFDELRAGSFGVVVGVIMANHLGLDIGDKISVTLPTLVITPMGAFPRVKRFTIVGIFEVGAQVDSTHAFIHLDDAAKLFRTGDSVHGVRLKLDDLFAAPVVRQQLQQSNSRALQFSDWSQSQGGLFQAIQMEKRVMGFLLMIVVLVAAFNIISIVVMMVSDKRAAVSVLRTMGMRARSAVAIFITQGSLIGIVGVLAGTAIGVLIASNISAIVAALESLLGAQMFDPSVYHIVRLPSLLRLNDVLLISGSAIVLSLLATLYPAWKASSIEAAEVLRYE